MTDQQATDLLMTIALNAPNYAEYDRIARKVIRIRDMGL